MSSLGILVGEVLYSERQADAVFSSVWANVVLPAMKQGKRLLLRIGPVSKTREQEEKYHAMISEVAEQAAHLGSKWDAESWKRLLLDEFAKETDRKRGRLIPSLSGDGVVEVGLLSRKFSVEDGAEFIEFLTAWGTQNGVGFSK